MERDRIVGVILGVAAAGTMLVMAHHPTDAHAAGLGALVHGTMIVLLAAIAWGFLQFAFQRGIRRPLVSAGLVAFAISVVGHLAAATINGFVVPAIVGTGVPISHDVLRFAWHANQAFAKLGVVATGIAYILWSIHLLRGGGAARWTGVAGLIVGAAMTVIVLLALLPMNVSGAMVVYALQAGWAVLVGGQMARGVLRSGQAT